MPYCPRFQKTVRKWRTYAMKGKKLIDLIGAACGLFLVAVLVVSLATGSLSSPAVAESGEAAPAAGTVLAVADAEHTGNEADDHGFRIKYAGNITL